VGLLSVALGGLYLTWLLVIPTENPRNPWASHQGGARAEGRWRRRSCGPAVVSWS